MISGCFLWIPPPHITRCHICPQLYLHNHLLQYVPSRHLLKPLHPHRTLSQHRPRNLNELW